MFARRSIVNVRWQWLRIRPPAKGSPWHLTCFWAGHLAWRTSMIPGAQMQRLVPVSEDARLDRFGLVVARGALFRGLPPSVLEDLTRRLQVRSRLAGAVLVAESDPGDAMFLIHQGKARVTLLGENGRELILSQLGPGDFFGEMSLLDGRPRSANVVAEEDMTLLVLTRDAFAEHLRAHPQTALNLLAELSLRLRRADETIADLALHDVHQRLVRTLERLAREDGEEQEGGLLLRRRPTQQDLANMVGSCRETISRTFTSLIKQGLMVPRGRSLLLTRRLLAA
ncbi:MAG: Crp/Fnr family transcriptional regulator [Myxococcales bacterium]|nr:Crp/Fnr family transcriptional regulator [Myxococcales bacterium]